MGYSSVGPSSAPRVQTADGLSLAEEAQGLRRELIETLYATGGGHYGGALSVVDMVLLLYRRVLRVSPSVPDHPGRDRFILSKGHAAIALYAILRRLGFFTDPLSSYGRTGSRLEGHPDMTALPGIDFSTGSLGQGLAVGLGMAMTLAPAERRVWVVLGDGECQEGQVWEAAMLAARYRVDNLHAVVDVNGFQECTWGPALPIDTQPVDNVATRWRSFGWRVLEADGHDFLDLESRFHEAMTTRDRPTVVLARSRKGKGFPLIERDPLRFHCTTVTAREQAELLHSLP
jgi:transketolase